VPHLVNGYTQLIALEGVDLMCDIFHVNQQSEDCFFLSSKPSVVGAIILVMFVFCFVLFFLLVVYNVVTFAWLHHRFGLLVEHELVPDCKYNHRSRSPWHCWFDSRNWISSLPWSYCMDPNYTLTLLLLVDVAVISISLLQVLQHGCRVMVIIHIATLNCIAI